MEQYKLGDDAPRRAHYTWHRGAHCNYIPSKKNLVEKAAVRKYVLDGWLPPEPFITDESVLTTFGSCFAKHIARYLQGKMKRAPSSNKRYCNARAIVYGAGMANTWTVLDQFVQAFTRGKVSDAHDDHGQRILPSPAEASASVRLFRDTDVFVITLGLSEIWEDRRSGSVLWHGVPAAEYDPKRHSFRVSSVEENYQNLHEIVRLVRQHNPTAHLVFTLSPVPLTATFRPVSCITANSVSKAILRVAVDEVMRVTQWENLHYWPSYEIVKEFYGLEAYHPDNRHLRANVIETIMQEFVGAYFV